MALKYFDELTPPQLSIIQQYIMPDTPLEPADIALLFGSRHGLDEFYVETMRLCSAGLYKYLVISGGITGGWLESEASVIKRGLIERGHPEEKIIIEDKATNTGQNITFAMKKIDDILGLDNIGSIIVIGKISSARRYLMTLEKNWPQPKKMMASINYFRTPREKWHENADFRNRVMAEINKIPTYIEHGFITELDPKKFPPLTQDFYL